MFQALSRVTKRSNRRGRPRASWPRDLYRSEAKDRGIAPEFRGDGARPSPRRP